MEFDASIFIDFLLYSVPIGSMGLLLSFDFIDVQKSDRPTWGSNPRP